MKTEDKDLFFESLKTPDNWQFKGWNNVTEDSGEILSYRKIFYDTDKRIFLAAGVVTASGRGFILEKRGENIYKAVIFNKTPLQLNEYINENY